MRGRLLLLWAGSGSKNLVLYCPSMKSRGLLIGIVGLLLFCLLAPAPVQAERGRHGHGGRRGHHGSYPRHYYHHRPGPIFFDDSFYYDDYGWYDPWGWDAGWYGPGPGFSFYYHSSPRAYRKKAKPKTAREKAADKKSAEAVKELKNPHKASIATQSR